MKQLLFIAMLLIGMTAQAQTRDLQGNYYAKATVVQDSTTQFTFTDSKGVVYPVYQGSKGGHYVIRVSKKTGKAYRQYLKVEGEL